MTDRPCTVPHCGRPHEGRGLCHSHLVYLNRTGTMPTKPIRSRDLATRFWAKVDTSGDCWLWRGATDGAGRYGCIGYQGKVRRAHRVSLLLAGRIDSVELPDGIDVDHLCRVTLCVRPDHLEVVTHSENVRRGESPIPLNAFKTHCPQGHPYEGDNLYVIPGSGGRVCRTCQRATGCERQRRHRERSRGGGA